MKSVAPNIDPTALSMYDKMYAGLEYDADTQCKHTYGNSSYLCKVKFCTKKGQIYLFF